MNVTVIWTQEQAVQALLGIRARQRSAPDRQAEQSARSAGDALAEAILASDPPPEPAAPMPEKVAGRKSQGSGA